MANMKYYKEGLETYLISTDEVVAGASKNFWDLFNPVATNARLLIFGIWAIPKTDVAVTGTLGVRFDFYKTSSTGTGGTGALWESPLPNVPTIAPLDTRNIEFGDPISNLLFRSVPTGGAAIGNYLFRRYIFSEETNAQTNAHQHFNLLPTSDEAQPLVIGQNEGLLCKQGTVASVNSYTFNILFGTQTLNQG
jgi:hypothetical protein